MNQEQLESILGERIKFLHIKQIEDKWIITKAYRIPDEDFKAVTETVKHYGGDWVSAGKGSHWYVPAGEQATEYDLREGAELKYERSPTQNAFAGVELDQVESTAEIKRAVLNQVGRAISILKQIEEDLS